MDRVALKEKVLRLKKEKGVLILAHTYQVPEVLEVADVVGDSFALSVAATKYEHETVLLCGVRFMAETVKILSPEKKVILSELWATCPMACQIAPEAVAEFKKENPHVAVVAYINTTTKLKAECDVCVTSSTAVKIVSRMEEKDILFIPDKNLGAYVAKQVPDKNIILWDGYCVVHSGVTEQDILKEKEKHPDALVAAHPECKPEVLAHADMIGSTSAIIQFIESTDRDVIVATERGVVDQLKLKYPGRGLYQLAPEKMTCRNMKMTDLESVYNALNGTGGSVIEIEEELRLKAKGCIDRMIELGS